MLRNSLIALLVGLPLAPALAAEPVNFTAVQPDLFAPPGALSSAWADYDNDGGLDLVVAYEHGVLRLFHNDKGVFTDVTFKAGLGPVADAEALKPIEFRSLAWGDFDGDGLLDLYVGARYAGKGDSPPQHRGLLYHNNGNGTFTEMAQKLGVDAPGADARQASWIDLDHDGKLDLFLAVRNGPNRMFHNDGGKFADIAAAVGLDDKRFSVGACWFDMDKDGDLDLFVANQDGGTDALYRNDGGKFTNIAPAQHMDHPERAKDEGGVGCTVGDYDNDGNLDLYVATYGEDFLYHNNGNGTFAEVSHAMGISGHGHMVGASWGDFDNDGLLDVFVTGYTHDNEPEDRLYRNTGKGFVNVITPALNHADHGIQWADYDRDGALDMTLTDDFSKTVARQTLLHNDLGEAARKRSLQVMVLDSKGHYAAGSEVRLYDAKGKLLATRLVNTGDGYDSQSVTPVHFGLASEGPVTVEVTYLTAKGRVTQRVSTVRPADYFGKALTVTQKP